MSVDIYALNLFIEHSREHWWVQNSFWSFTTPQAFWQSSAPGALSILVTLVVLYSLTRATLISLGKDKTRVCGYILYIYIYIYIYMYISRKSQSINEILKRIYFILLSCNQKFGSERHKNFWAAFFGPHNQKSTKFCNK